ncbi:MAG: DUF72 domain-containing protein [Polyangiaceae bacterium]
MGARADRSLVIPEPDPARLADATALADQARLPARAGAVWFGTAGWTDPTLVKSGSFYPKVSQSAEERLGFYAEHFSLVEVDATYYSLLPVETARRWAEWTPAEFVFDVKAHPVVTGHPVDVTRLPKDLREALRAHSDKPRIYPRDLPGELAREMEARFFALLEPLRDAGKLGCVLAQFPPWFSATRGNARAVQALRERWPEVPFAVEFRHKSWLEPERRERVTRLLTEHRLSYVCVDEPPARVGGLPGAVFVTHPELAVVRFHGHNLAGWNRRGASVHERFDYLYSSAELRTWVEPVQRLAREAKRVHAVFNNCVRNYAVLGAKGLSVLLTAGSDPTAGPATA